MEVLTIDNGLKRLVAAPNDWLSDGPEHGVHRLTEGFDDEDVVDRDRPRLIACADGRFFLPNGVHDEPSSICGLGTDHDH
jgi:hypothetical protein